MVTIREAEEKVAEAFLQYAKAIEERAYLEEEINTMIRIKMREGSI